MKYIKNLVFLLLFTVTFLSINNLKAQVNTETLISQHSHSPFTTTADLNHTFIRGNTNLTQTNLGLASIMGSNVPELKPYPGIRFINYFNLSIANSRQNLINERKFFHTRIMKNFHYNKSLVHEYFYQYQDDVNNRIKRRNIMGFNIRKYFFLETEFNLSSGFGIFYEKEKSTHKENENLLRTNLFVSSSKLKKFRNFTLVFYLQNNVINPMDFRTLLESSFEIPLLIKDDPRTVFTSINTRISLTYRYDSIPFENVSNHDLTFMLNLVGTLKMH